MEALRKRTKCQKFKFKLSLKLKDQKMDSIIVDKFFKTSNKNIYAIGDVIDKVQLTPVAIAEAMYIIDNILKKI